MAPNALAAVLPIVRLDYLKVDAKRWSTFDAAGGARQVLAKVRASGTELLLKRVETSAHRQLAGACGASRMQGYLLSEPVMARRWGGVVRGSIKLPRGRDSVPA